MATKNEEEIGYAEALKELETILAELERTDVMLMFWQVALNAHLNSFVCVVTESVMPNCRLTML